MVRFFVYFTNQQKQWSQRCVNTFKFIIKIEYGYNINEKR